ncbi:Lacal_2735 family protein [Aquimarina sp. MMG016]|uniref:Lacal_2735 family protein n=1 Tax=Aquimarina sp. MMG016 TaxID=2822690 RepID=UPI001B3A421D|nr:Lacal_2735 family protein [Aquimarina sp. MMG016]MBQ4822730.1 Lacal_2735 family protein [Aquimarina sp. MMG016]
MFGLFKKKSKKEVLTKKYQQLMEESYKLSHTNRKASDDKSAEAEEIMKQIETIED